jgi:UDP-N-acetylmuramoyl-tripeptide--D-alanyl-D-alanine ligase
MSLPVWTAEEAAAAVGVRPGAAWQATGVSIDTRTLARGDLFVALKGPKHDGHDHVAAALANGAAAALVDRAPPGLPAGAPLLVVGDTLAALEMLGRASRARNATVRVAAVTGSVGKTGTKEALKLALGGQGATHASVGSYNNHIGVPLTLARMPADTAFGVFEIGMNHANEITPLVRMVRPHVAVITTVEAVHVENFPGAGLNGVAAAKAEIFDGLDGGTAVLNRDNAFFDFLTERARAKGVRRVLSFGEHPSCDARVVEMRLEATWSQVSAMIDGRAVTYRIGAPGRHWVINSLAVLGAIAALGGDIGVGAASLAQLAAPKGRGLRHKVGRNGGSFELIDDSYNASPASMRASFQVLAAATPGAGGRRIAVLGDMLELGPDSPKLHAGLADALVAAKVDQVFTCGQYMARLYDALPAAMRGAHTPGSEALVPLVRAAVRAGDVVVVKGSLGSRMGRIVDALLAGAANTNGSGGPQGRAANG